MDALDLMIEIDRYVSRSGLTHDDSIKDLIDSLAQEVIED